MDIKRNSWHLLRILLHTDTPVAFVVYTECTQYLSVWCALLLLQHGMPNSYDAYYHDLYKTYPWRLY